MERAQTAGLSAVSGDIRVPARVSVATIEGSSCQLLTVTRNEVISTHWKMMMSHLGNVNN